LRPGLELHLVDRAGTELETQVDWGDSPDIASHFAGDLPYIGLDSARFELRGRCSGRCGLRLRRADGRTWTLPLDGTRRTLDRPHAKAHLDAVLRSGWDQFGVQRRLDTRRWGVVLGIGRVYEVVMPWLSAAAAISFVAAGAWQLRRRRLSRAWLTAAVLGTAIISRIALVALIDVVSFDALQSRYLSPAYPLLLLFVALSLTSAWREPRPGPTQQTLSGAGRPGWPKK
jgi:hypothetical protein